MKFLLIRFHKESIIHEVFIRAAVTIVHYNIFIPVRVTLSITRGDKDYRPAPPRFFVLLRSQLVSPGGSHGIPTVHPSCLPRLKLFSQPLPLSVINSSTQSAPLLNNYSRRFVALVRYTSCCQVCKLPPPPTTKQRIFSSPDQRTS